MARKARPRCTFCLRVRSRILLKGRKGSHICDVCILLAMHALVDDTARKTGGAP